MKIVCPLWRGGNDLVLGEGGTCWRGCVCWARRSGAQARHLLRMWADPSQTGLTWLLTFRHFLLILRVVLFPPSSSQHSGCQWRRSSPWQGDGPHDRPHPCVGDADPLEWGVAAGVQENVEEAQGARERVHAPGQQGNSGNRTACGEG